MMIASGGTSGLGVTATSVIDLSGNRQNERFRVGAAPIKRVF
jgi:hypothetical protein